MRRGKKKTAANLLPVDKDTNTATSQASGTAPAEIETIGTAPSTPVVENAAADAVPDDQYATATAQVQGSVGADAEAAEPQPSAAVENGQALGDVTQAAMAAPLVESTPARRAVRTPRGKTARAKGAPQPPLGQAAAIDAEATPAEPAPAVVAQDVPVSGDMPVPAAAAAPVEDAAVQAAAPQSDTAPEAEAALETAAAPEAEPAERKPRRASAKRTSAAKGGTADSAVAAPTKPAKVKTTKVAKGAALTAASEMAQAEEAAEPPAVVPPAPATAPLPTVPARQMRVLLLSHMDPRVSKGGAEIAAFQLYHELNRRKEFKPYFLSCAPGKIELRDGVVFAQPFGVDNYVYATRGFDHFIYSNPDSELRAEFTALLQQINPDVVHLHHYTNFGLETLLIIREALPKARVVMTLHEYLAICNHFGQMVKRPNFSLCERATPQACSTCFPERSPQDFFLRQMFIQRFFRLVDHFVSPSAFLAERYIAWGIPRDRISVIENGVPNLERRGKLPYPSVKRELTFGFFGQISRLKGINVLLDAAAQLNEADGDIRIEVHGDYSSQPEPFQKDFRDRLANAPENFYYRGPYDNSRVDQLMQSVHAVLVPSIWWENSPLVIQEALANKRPVICSDIGGMAEKVRNGLDGFHFTANSGWSLAALLRRLAADRSLLSNIQNTIATPPSVAETAEQMINVYAS